MINVNTINFPAQESNNARIQAMAETLGAELGWEATGSDDGTVWKVWHPDNQLGFHFSNVSGAYFNLGICNSLGAVVTYNVLSSISAETLTRLHYLCTDNTFVIGASINNGSSIELSSCIAKQDDGKYSAICINTFTSGDTGKIIKPEIPVVLPLDLPINNNSNVSTSIIKMPAIYSNSIYKDLYIMNSCPSTLKDKIFYIGGKWYRHIGRGSYGLAIAVG